MVEQEGIKPRNLEKNQNKTRKQKDYEPKQSIKDGLKPKKQGYRKETIQRNGGNVPKSN